MSAQEWPHWIGFKFLVSQKVELYDIRLKAREKYGLVCAPDDLDPPTDHPAPLCSNLV